MSQKGLMVLALIISALYGCESDTDFPDLKNYMAAARAKPKGSIEPLPVFPPYEAFTYSASGLRSPFLPPDKVELAKKQQGASHVHPDERRVKQFLEGFNIEDFSMVGTLANQGGMYGLLRGAGGVHRVKVGDYVGRNHGRIVAIDNARIDVVEIVPDGDGGWLERPRSLLLKERSS